MNKNYGLPYMGSKNGIAKDICEYMLSRHSNKKYFIDACCGGFAISHYIYENTKMIIFANDLDENLIAFYRKILNGEINELFEKYNYKWIDRDTYFKLEKSDDKALRTYLVCIWTFGNKNADKLTYLYGKDIELQKELLHNLIVYGNEEHLTPYFKEHAREREKELNQIRDWWNNLPNSIKNAKYYSIDQRRLAIMSEWKAYARQNSIDILQLQQQQQQRVENVVESLSKTTQVESMSRQERVKEVVDDLKPKEEISRLQNLERLNQLQNLNRINLSNTDCIAFLNSLPNEILENAIVYLDPPYVGTAEYKEGDNTLKDRIVEWAIKHKDICPVYVSEYSKYEGLQDCFYVNKMQTLSSESEHRTVKKERLLYNGYPKVDETLGDLLGLWN